MTDKNSEIEIYEEDLCVVIRCSIEDFGVERCQEIEKMLDKAFLPFGYMRVGSDKEHDQIFIRFASRSCEICEHENSLDFDGAIGCPFEKICEKEPFRMFKSKE